MGLFRVQIYWVELYSNRFPVIRSYGNLNLWITINWVHHEWRLTFHLRLVNVLHCIELLNWWSAGYFEKYISPTK